MRRFSLLAVSLLVITTACSSRQADGHDDPDLGVPQWSECVVAGEYETCADVCAMQGMQCAALACPADPLYCKPNDCDMATSVIGLGEGICSDPSVGGFVAASCDDPIEFIFTDTARCCCEA